jgi:predicted dehydrogenase
VVDIDEEVARELAADASINDVYTDYTDLLADDGIDAVSVCVHNNLHAPIAVASFEADKHVFCEKPMAGSYADAKRMADAADEAGKRLAVQNTRLFSPETTAAKRLIDDGRLGEVSFARAVSARRRGRPYVDGYGTPSFVQKATAAGGPVYDIGTYEIGQMLYLLDNPTVERVVGHTFEYTDDLREELVGDNLSTYRERLTESGYDVEDAGTGVATLAGDRVLSVRAAWHMYLPDEQSVIAGSKGGIAFDPFEFRTTMADYETTVSLDLDEYEQRQALLESDTGYDADRRTDQFSHWIETLRGTVDPIPTDEIALNSMLMMEGIYLSVEQGRELTTEDIADYSESVAIEP